LAIRGINHIVLRVRDLEAADAFYRGVLGLEKVGDRGRMWFYSTGVHHHDLALMEARTFAASGHGALFHFCLDVSDESALAEIYERCWTSGAHILGTADHTIMRSFYVSDPDGNVVKLGVDVPRENWGTGDPFAADRPYNIPVLKR
jgi:catechol 2,3-dioxygenase